MWEGEAKTARARTKETQTISDVKSMRWTHSFFLGDLRTSYRWLPGLVGRFGRVGLAGVVGLVGLL